MQKLGLSYLLADESSNGSIQRAADVRFGSKADICTAPAHVRFTPKSGHEMANCDLWNLNVRYGAKNVRFTPES
jgi:hypothetical protein